MSVFANQSKENNEADVNLLVVRLSFVMNLIFGIFKLNSFQLARGYIPVVVRLLTNMLTKDIQEKHMMITTHRAIQIMAMSRTPNIVSRYMIKGVNKIFLF